MRVRKLLTTMMLCSLCLSATISVGQKALHKANKQYELRHYDLAIDSYKEYLVIDPSNTTAKAQLADSYRMSNQLVEAADLYSHLVTVEDIDPLVIRNYGLTLMKMGKYDQAKYYFQIYRVYDPQEGEHYDMACDFAKHTFEKAAIHEVELVNVNTPSSDFGVTFFGDQIVFSSFRNDISSKDEEKGTALNGNILYIADLDQDMRASNVRFLRSAISEKVNVGPVSYNEGGGLVAFARNKIKNGGAHVTGDDSKHSLYIGELTSNGDWKEEQSFRYNEFGTSTAFPCLAFDGSALYFASNRVGGYGGYDIYVSYKKEGEWTYPTNLGPNINSKGNEITPFFVDETLYFASDYMHGMGGYDIFSTSVSGGQWSFPTNLGNGINSPGDDYYPAKKRGSDLLLFSSNRLGGKGNDDIYLAAPISADEELADASTPPPAVNLADLAQYSGSAPSNVQEVAQVETTTVQVLEPATIIEIAALATRPLPTLSAGVAEDLTADAVAYTIPEALETDNLTDDVTTDPGIVAAEGAAATVNTTLVQDTDGTFVETIIVQQPVTADETTAVTTEEAETTPTMDESVVSEGTDNAAVETQVTEIVVAEPTAAVKPEAYAIPDFKSVSAAAAPLNADISEAKRVALDEILPVSEVYFIQLAALYNSKGNVDKFTRLKKYGNLYKVYKSNSTKIKLGYFLDKSEATTVLAQIRSQGYGDAFITRDQLNSNELELIIASDAQPQYESYTSEPVVSASSNKSYKIRLASYEDPIWFDIASAKGLGQIEQWTKGGWTIFILSGYSSYQDAENARIRAVNKGFSDAEVVIDNNGILERLRMN